MNRIDSNGLKQGYWEEKVGENRYSKGNYVDSKRVGVWIILDNAYINWRFYYMRGFWLQYLRVCSKTETMEYSINTTNSTIDVHIEEL